MSNNDINNSNVHSLDLGQSTIYELTAEELKLLILFRRSNLSLAKIKKQII